MLDILKRQRWLWAAVLILTGLTQVPYFGINSILAPILTKEIIGLQVATILGIATVVIAVLLHRRDLG